MHKGNMKNCKTYTWKNTVHSLLMTIMSAFTCIGLNARGLLKGEPAHRMCHVQQLDTFANQKTQHGHRSLTLSWYAVF